MLQTVATDCLEVDQVEMDGVSLPEIIDDVDILDSSDLWVLTCSAIEHVVSSNHKVHISWQTEKRSMSFD